MNVPSLDFFLLLVPGCAPHCRLLFAVPTKPPSNMLSYKWIHLCKTWNMEISHMLIPKMLIPKMLIGKLTYKVRTNFSMWLAIGKIDPNKVYNQSWAFGRGVLPNYKRVNLMQYKQMSHNV